MNAIFRSTFLAIAMSILSLSASAHGTVAFTDGHWWNGSTFEDRTMYSVEGVLHESTDESSITSTVSLDGSFVMPAFGNAHQHAFADGANLDAQIARALSSGVFYFANPNNIERLTREARKRVNLAESVDVIYSNGGLTATGGHPVQIYRQIGPQLGLRPDEADGQAYFIIDDEKQLDARWPAILEGKPDFIKTYLETSEEYEKRRDDPEFAGKKGLDPALLPIIVRKAHAAGLRVAAHVTTRHDFLVAVRAGVDMIAHLPLERLTDDDAEEAAKRGTTVVTTVLSHRPAPGITDLKALHKANLELLVRHGVPLAFGTDNGGVDVIDEALAVFELGVVSRESVINLLSRETPKLIFPDRRIGCVAEGCEASFVAVSGNPTTDLANLRKVAIRVKKGHVLQVQAPAEKRSVLHAIAGTFHSKGVDAALAEYRRLRHDEPDNWDFSEPQLNAFGYQLLQHGAVDQAIKVFETNAEFFPESSNVWDSLGEAWRKKGDREKAIELYEKSLKLNPNSESGKAALQQLQEGN